MRILPAFMIRARRPNNSKRSGSLAKCKPQKLDFFCLDVVIHCKHFSPLCNLMKCLCQQHLRHGLMQMIYTYTYIYIACYQCHTSYSNNYLLNCEVTETLFSFFLSITPNWSLPATQVSKELPSFCSEVCISNESDTVTQKFQAIKTPQKNKRLKKINCWILKHAYLENHLKDWYLNGLHLIADAAICHPHVSAFMKIKFCNLLLYLTTYVCYSLSHI